MNSLKNIFFEQLTLDEWTPRPNSNYFELVYVVDGAGKQCINYNNFEFEKGNLFLLPPLKCHTFKLARKTSFVFLKYPQAFFLPQNSQSGNFEAWYKELSYILLNYRQKPGDIIAEPRDKNAILQLISLISNEQQHHAEQQLNLIRSYMVSILHIVMRNLPLINKEISFNDTKIQDILHYIQEHIAQPTALKTEVIANHFHLSPNYVSEYFKKAVGCSLKEHVTKSRLKLVEIRLLNSQLTMNEIADELGFSDASHLARTFKKNTGMTLLEFKNRGDYCLLKVG